MARISVVVPVYKAEQYLDKCVGSLIAQTYRDFEIILVDDGSPDNCGAICDNFAKEHPELIKVVHMENSGVSAARNTGISLAVGEWIMFVDGDDWVEADMLEAMVKEAESADCDLCISGYIEEYPNHSIRYEFSRLSGYQLTNADKLNLFKHNLYTGGIGNFEENIGIRGICTKLFRKKLLTDNNIAFENDIWMGEDVLLNMYAVQLSAKTMFLMGAYYHYRRHPSQATNKYLPDESVITEKYLKELLIFANRFYSEEEAASLYNNQVVSMKLLAISLTHIVSSPYSLRQRISGIKASINREPLKMAIKNVSYRFFPREMQLQIWFLRHLPVSFYYFGLKAIYRWKRGSIHTMKKEK